MSAATAIFIFITIATVGAWAWLEWRSWGGE